VRICCVRSSSSQPMVSSRAYSWGVLLSLCGRLQFCWMYSFCGSVVLLLISATNRSFWLRFVLGIVWL